jgi:hypothetical protein
MITYINKYILILFFSLISLFACTTNKQATTTKTNVEIKEKPITVTGSDYGNFIKIGSKYTSETLDKSKINVVPVGGENQIWDLRKYKMVNHVRDTTLDNHPVPAGTSFTSATFVRNHQSDFIKDFSYTEFFEMSDDGFYKLGVKVDKATANLGNGILLKSTGEEDPIHPKDLIFKFPMNYHDKTHYEGSLVEQYSLTVPSMGFADVPVERKLSMTTKSEVIGWGKLLLPEGALDEKVDVLLIRNEESLTANYLFNGGAAPEALLKMLNLKEGSTHYLVFYSFISKEHGLVTSISFDKDDKNENVLFPAIFADYIVEKHD